MRRYQDKAHFCEKNRCAVKLPKTPKCNSMEAVSLQIQEQVTALVHVLFRKKHCSAQETQWLVVIALSCSCCIKNVTHRYVTEQQY